MIDARSVHRLLAHHHRHKLYNHIHIFLFSNRLQGSYRHLYAFLQDFPGLGKTKFKGFPGLKNPFFQDFPGNVPFKTLVAQGQKVHIQDRRPVINVSALKTKEVEMQYLRLYYCTVNSTPVNPD